MGLALVQALDAFDKLDHGDDGAHDGGYRYDEQGYFNMAIALYAWIRTEQTTGSTV